jgi:hypothetical protein
MNIFYTEVDKNLQQELNARGKAGFQNRTTAAIDFMVGKIANVELTAFQGNDSKSGIVNNPQAVLGGRNVQAGRYMPSGPNGYLTNYEGTRQELNFHDANSVAEKNRIAKQKTGQLDSTAIVGNAYLKDTKVQDQSRRTGPYVTGVDIAIGDHSMGLLNKATITLVVPNVSRDLDDIEEVWLRPGRYVSIVIQHPKSAIITKSGAATSFGSEIGITGGYLTSRSLPNKERIQELYPDWNVDEFLKRISEMNTFIFEGLITSFDFSYTKEGTVDVNLSLTGTSNVYTDVSMFLSGDKKTEQKSSPTANTENFEIKPIISTAPPLPGVTPQPLQINDVIHQRIEKLKNDFVQNFTGAAGFEDFLLPFTIENNNSNATDHFFLIGNQILPKITPNQIPDATSQYKYGGAIKNKILQVAKLDPQERSKALATPAVAPATGSTPRDPATIPKPETIPALTTLTKESIIEQFTAAVTALKANNLITSKEETLFNEDLKRATDERTAEEKRVSDKNTKNEEFIAKFNQAEGTQNFNRYITLGALVHVINQYVVTNVTGSVTAAKILHSDSMNYSNYYPNLVSVDPDAVLFLPKDPSVPNDMNSYEDGNSATTGLVYYRNIVKQLNNTGANAQTLQKAGWKEWPGVYEKQDTNARMYPSRIFINLDNIKAIIDNLTNSGKNTYTVKSFIASISALISKCSANAIDLKLITYPTDQTKLLLTDTRYLKSKSEQVLPYSVPMFANHPNGSIVREFSFSAKLPDSVKNLSYVLNQGDEITEDQIAPYMNFMYNAKNPELVNKALGLYKDKYATYISQLDSARINYGLSPGVPERKQALYKALTNYVKYPTADIRTSQQITAPIFPFEVEFTIDGINGLRYGDVLKFDALPYKYRANTVFSIIGITHTVSSDGEWLTKVKCIMRPSIG